MQPCPVPEYEGVTLERLNITSVYPDIDFLARTPSRCCQLRYNISNPNVPKAILKTVDFRKKLENEVIAEEADRNIPFINAQPFTQKIIDYRVTKQCYVGLYEYIDAEDLFDYSARRRNEQNPLTVAEAASIMMEVAEIMVPLHALKVVHRNIKLGNILRRKSDGQIFLGDFSYGSMLRGKLLFKAIFYEKECLLNLNYDNQQSIYSISPYNQDNYSTLVCFCQLLGKVFLSSPAVGKDAGSFVDMTSVTPPIPPDVAEQIKEITYNDGQGNRPTMKQIQQFLQRLSGKNCMMPQITFPLDKDTQLKAAIEITQTEVCMIHPCSDLDDSVFCNYLKVLENKKNHPFEKIKIHFGGNNLTELGCLGMSQAFQNMNTSNLRTISIQLNNNNLGSIDSLVKELRQLSFPVLSKFSVGFNGCCLKISDIRDTWEIANKQFNPDIMRKLQLDFRNNCDDTSQLVLKYQSIKNKFKTKINGKQTNQKSDYFFMKYDTGFK